MKNRILCLLLALCLVVVMLPAAAVPVSAAQAMSASENLVALIKQLEGFRSTAYVSGGQWSIGYGTSGSPGQTITEAAADQALRAHLSTVEEKLNSFASKWNRNFTQQQFDALACFSYNCGTGWMNASGRLRDAITSGASEEKFLFAMSLWANNGTSPDPGLLQRRMAEADVYLNGTYQKKSTTYTYTIFDANGGTPGSSGEDKMQGYRKDGSTQILVADPTLAGHEFAGWYTQRNGGTRVTTLGSDTAGKTLYAQYRSNGGTPWVGAEETLTGSDGSTTVIASGTVNCTTYVNVRKGPGTNYSILSRAASGTEVEIFQTTWTGSTQWARTSGGWMSMEYISLSGSSGSISGNGGTANPETGTVTGSNVNVRSGPGTGYGVVGRKNTGDSVTVSEKRTSGGLSWGRIGDSQWICLSYVRLGSSGGTPESGSESGASSNGSGSTEIVDTGTVSSSTALNVRSGPGTGYARIRSLSPGTSVSIYEYETAGGVQWGRIGSSQWVCMTYIRVAQESDGSATGTGTVISSTVLNVRSGPGTAYSRVGQLTPGSAVEITEQTQAAGVWWGKTSQGWVCMQYVNMGSSL